MEAFLMNPFFSPAYSRSSPSYGHSPRRGWTASEVPRNYYPVRSNPYYQEEDNVEPMEEDEDEYQQPFLGPYGRNLSQRDLMLLRRRLMAQKEMERQRKEAEMRKLKELERERELMELERQEKLKRELLKKKQLQQQQQQAQKQVKLNRFTSPQEESFSIPVRHLPSSNKIVQEDREEALRKKQELNRKRAALVFMFNHAAKKIQRAFRAYQAKKFKEEEERNLIEAQKLAEKKEMSAFILQRAFKHFLEVKKQKEVSQKLRKLREMKSKVMNLKESHEKQVFENPIFNPNGTINKKYLEYEDLLVKTLIQLDSVSSEGNDLIRLYRKRLIDFVQGLLDSVDQLKQREKNSMSVDV